MIGVCVCDLIENLMNKLSDNCTIDVECLADLAGKPDVTEGISLKNRRIFHVRRIMRAARNRRAAPLKARAARHILAPQAPESQKRAQRVNSARSAL